MNSSYETKVFRVHTEGDRFGFTLAGQYPCQLVKIQHGSPAEKAGLRSGDEVIEVDGVNVEDLKHDCVASFITPSAAGITELRVRRSASGSHARTVKTCQDVQKSVSENVACATSPLNNLSKVVDRVVEEFKRPPTSISTPSPVRQRGLDPFVFNGSDMASDDELRATFSPDTTSLNTNTTASISSPFRPSTELAHKSDHGVGETFKMELVLGYLGSIDRPRTTQTTSDLLLVRLRAKTNSPVPVLLEVSPSTLYLRNAAKQIIMSWPVTSLVYGGICPDKKQFLGLFAGNGNVEGSRVVNGGDVTATSDLSLNCSCHLFLIEPCLIRHSNHKPLTDRFQLRCVADPATGSCQQFPSSSVAILNALSAHLNQIATQVASNADEDRRKVFPARFDEKALNQGTGLSLERPGNDVHECSTRTTSCQAEQDGCNDEEQVLCLHLHRLTDSDLTRQQDMDYKPKGEDTGCARVSNMATGSKHYGSVGHGLISSTEMVTSARINHVQVASVSTQETSRIDQSMTKDTLKPSDQVKTVQKGHKTLVHRRSQSLASNMKTTLQACAAVATVSQTVECFSNADLQISNGPSRPIYHASSASVMAYHKVTTVEGKVARWAVSFDRLLDDKTGVDIFRCFLQKEYSEENLIFWLACEKYKKIEDKNELKKCADEIYDMHLKNCAELPVNVESSAIREVEARFQCPTKDLFAALQHQVYTLMKFDSYSRFLKSELYQKCLVNEIEGKALPFEQGQEGDKEVDEGKKEEVEEGTGTLKRMVKFSPLRNREIEDYFSDSGICSSNGLKFSSSSRGKGRKMLNKSQNTTSESDETKKKLFLPWRGRLKSDQPKRTTNRSSDSQASSTRSSLSSLSDSVFSSNVTNSDETLNDSDGKDQPPPSCKVILPNRSLMYLFCKSTHSLKEGLSKLCEKKEYSLPALDLFIAERKLTKGDLQRKLTRFINKEIILKQGVLFRLELPNGKSIGIKANREQTIDKVIQPILQQSSLGIKDVCIRLRNNMKPLDTSSSITPLHQQHVMVEEHSAKKVREARNNVDTNANNVGKAMTNRSHPRPGTLTREDAVFDAIMAGKRQSMSGFFFDENGVFVPEMKQTSSKESLSSSGKEKDRFTRSPALFRKKKRDGPQSLSSFQTFLVEDDKKNAEELFSLLRRAHNSRIDDQRGLLDQKPELPDFLKLPEKSSKRNTFLDVGVPSPRPRHQPLKKSTSSPPSYMPTTNQLAKNQPASITEQPNPQEANERQRSSTLTKADTGITRNWSGSSLSRGRTRVETVKQVVIETQTVDRRRFLKPFPKDATSGNRLRSGSLPQDHPDDRLHAPLTTGSEVKARGRYYYGSESSVENNSDKHVVWVSNAVNRNRRRGASNMDKSADTSNEIQTDDEGVGNPRLRKAEVIIPETNSDASRFAVTGGVLPYLDRPVPNIKRPKPITDSTFFREYLESSHLEMPTPGGEPKVRDLDTANDRGVILDSSFLRDQLKPSRLFSQLSPDVSSPLATSSPAERRRLEGSMKCPLFIPKNFSSTAEGDTPVAANTLRSRGNNGVAMNELEDESSRHVYWGLSELSNEEEAVRVTFV